MPTLHLGASPAADWLPVAVFFFIAVVVSVVMIVIPG